MKYVFFIFLIVFAFARVEAQNTGENATSIRQQMAKIRQSTNWDDPEAAKKANEQIRELSKKLLQSAKPQQPQGTPTEIIDEQNEDKMQIIDQILKSASQGEEADVLLGEPIRKKIIESYQEDESPKNINQQFFQEVTLLVIDMSSQLVKNTIDQMKNYKSIKTLIITGGKNGAAVDLPMLLDKAAAYPLEQLYIINFRNFVSNIPAQIGKFKNLHTISLYNNTLKNIPSSLALLNGIDSLYVDVNPIASLFPEVGNLKSLKKLGIGRTSIPDSEVLKIQQLLPDCQILKQ
jgi:Leucine-rich repeat (LRR) protein